MQRLHEMTHVYTQAPWQSCIAAMQGIVFSMTVTLACIA